MIMKKIKWKVMLFVAWLLSTNFKRNTEVR